MLSPLLDMAILYVVNGCINENTNIMGTILTDTKLP